MQHGGQTACLMFMNEMSPFVRSVTGPNGDDLTFADLPPENTRRWVIRRKAEVVAAVRGGLLNLDDACKRYKLTVDEFLAWHRLISRHGLQGLRATKVRDYGSSASSGSPGEPSRNR
jgi:Protein of unknown function (DUF1153)